MRRLTRNGMIAVAAASGALVAAPAHADSAADGTAAQSPGAVSGNTIQLPVHLPVNVCGNTVNVVGLLNPAAGNSCANHGHGGHGGHNGHSDDGGYGSHNGDGAAGGTSGTPGSSASSVTEGSPGVVSGNGVQLPVDLPVNVSGNSVDVVGVLNPSLGNTSVNGPGTPQTPETPEVSTPETPKPAPPKAHPTPETRTVPPQPGPRTGPVLASTGADSTLPAALGSGALILAGATLYRRTRRLGAGR